MSEPFEEDPQPSTQAQKISLKSVSTQKSIFEQMQKKPSQEEFNKQVQNVQDRNLTYKTKVAELAIQFNKVMSDKTLKQNKNIFAIELEKELLSKMIQLAVDINIDPNEQEGMGSLGWITLLLKTCFFQRDKINQLEYDVNQLNLKIRDIFVQNDRNKKNEE